MSYAKFNRQVVAERAKLWIAHEESQITEIFKRYDSGKISFGLPAELQAVSHSAPILTMCRNAEDDVVFLSKDDCYIFNAPPKLLKPSEAQA